MSWLRGLLMGLGTGRYSIDYGGWIHGPNVKLRPAHWSWVGPKDRYAMPTPHHGPIGNVMHYTDTPYGTARTMAEFRQQHVEDAKRQRNPGWFPAIWHFTIAHNGWVWQQLPLTSRAYHCKATQPALHRLKGQRPNAVLLGWEFEGGGHYTDRQIETAIHLMRCVTWHYKMDPRYVMLYHSELNPESRDDPGPEFERKHAKKILRAAFRGA